MYVSAKLYQVYRLVESQSLVEMLSYLFLIDIARKAGVTGVLWTCRVSSYTVDDCDKSSPPGVVTKKSPTSSTN